MSITYSSNPFPPTADPLIQTHLNEQRGEITPHPYYKHLLDQMDDLNMQQLPDIGEAIRHSDLLYVCSDGLHNHSTWFGSHAWVFSTVDVEVL